MSAKRTPPSVGEGYLLLTPGDTLALNDQYYAGENAGWVSVAEHRVGKLVTPHQPIRRRDPSVELPMEPEPVEPEPAVIRPSLTPEQIYTAWSRTPDGLKVTDTGVPGDPVRLGSILDDNARIAFLAGYHAASPSFE